MNRYKITVETKKHFESLIKDYREIGMKLVTYTERFAELEDETSFITIQIV